MKFVFLSGGTGTPKLMQGFRHILPDKKIGVLCNSGDDYVWNGLYICPDLDTVLYQFSGKLDTEKFWGVEGDTFESLKTLKSLSAEDTWFNVGDRDLGLHIYRSLKLRKESLTRVTKKICSKWDIEAEILPMSDNPIQSRIFSEDKNYHFQEYFVKLQTNVNVTDVKFHGDSKETTEEVSNMLEVAKQIIIGPSNPITSIGPILSIKKIYSLLEQHRDKVLVISPLKGSEAFSGPTVKLMKTMNIDSTPLGIANFYQKIASKIIFDSEDISFRDKIKDLNIEPIFHSIDLSTLDQKKKLSTTIFDFI